MCKLQYSPIRRMFDESIEEVFEESDISEDSILSDELNMTWYLFCQNCKQPQFPESAIQGRIGCDKSLYIVQFELIGEPSAFGVIGSQWFCYHCGRRGVYSQKYMIPSTNALVDSAICYEYFLVHSKHFVLDLWNND